MNPAGGQESAANGEGNGIRRTDGVRSFDARLIAEYDGSGDIVEWFSRTEMLCELNAVPMMTVVPLRLTGGAFAVWAQLPPETRTSLDDVRSALFAAFALDQYAAYESFSVRRLRAGESTDVYLADLRRLATLFGGIPERALACAFIAGLPDSVRQTIRAGSRAESLNLADVLARARSVLSDQRGPVAAAAARARPESGRSARGQPHLRPVVPYQQRDEQPSPRQQEEQRDVAVMHNTLNRRQRRCWICGVLGHISVSCPQRGNGQGDGGSALPSSPMQQ